MTNYLITGGAGFIGSHITRELLKRAGNVKVIDNLITGNLKNLTDIVDQIEFIKGDIRDLDLLKRVFSGVDYILHQAALPSVPRSVIDPIATNQHNIDGTLNVLVAARDCGVKRVVYAASSSAYGDKAIEYKSEDLPINPLSPYALTKQVGETYCRLFSQLYGLETVSLRYFNVFGPYQNPLSQYAAVIPKFITTMLKGQSPTIFGDGQQSRDFTYISNNVQANILATTSKKIGKGEIINIACGSSISLNDLVGLINQELATDLKAIHLAERQGDVKHSKADIRLSEELLDYKPIKDFKTGLKETIKWYQKKTSVK